MSDLCYNCGNCHLPSPCLVPLKLCDICRSWGHNYNFCPLSVRKKEPNYQFWALCHNCDSWHLPDECTLSLHTCAQCAHTGHLEYFCPVNALSRQATHALKDAKTGTKRQRTSKSDIKPNSIDVNDPLRGEHVRLIKAEAAREVLDLRNRGYADHDILQHITAAPPQAPYGNSYATSPPGDSVFKVSSINGTPSTSATSISQQPVTPSSTSLYTSQQERFSSGELLQSVTSSYQNPNVPIASTETNNTPAPRKKGNRAPANSACTECKGSKKRCPHKGGTTGMEGSNSEQLNTGLPPPPGYVDGSIFFDQGARNSQEWVPSFGTTMTAPYHPAGTMQASFTTAYSTPTDHMPSSEKNSLAHLLNNTQATGPATQTNPGTLKPFTYSAIGNDLPQNTSLDTKKQLPAMSDEYGGGVVSQMSTQQPQPMASQGLTNDVIMAPTATQEPVQTPVQESVQGPESQEPEPVQEPLAEAKTKKGRGRPKRKN